MRHIILAGAVLASLSVPGQPMIDRDLSQTELAMIESIIDHAGLAAFLEGVPSICGGKAEHIDPCARRPRAKALIAQ
jgi:hypothetical protein